MQTRKATGPSSHVLMRQSSEGLDWSLAQRGCVPTDTDEEVSQAAVRAENKWSAELEVEWIYKSSVGCD